ncbi:DNA-directed RNA polymerase I subunit RPA49-like [Aricia agestis]|uniref:DNA-directed RNA polymerase I subunit RPA49-like n=1 Tax=Aricia agestis TaxID=91739 RepID=UPI001C203E22|nr:DNA-directed RNA polymerase I subunit RPA49-like [Aricia agestis]
MSKLQITEVCPKGTTYPLIANFLHGNPTDHFMAEECLLLKNEENNLKTVLTKVDNLLYVGDEEEDALSKTFIVKRNRNTGKVQILDAGIVNLKPVIYDNNDVTSMEVNNLELSRKFGSKKQKQIMEQREKLKVNVETVTEQMQNVTQEITEDTLDLSAYQNTNSDDFYIPTIDREATKAEDVYKVENMLTEAQYDIIISEIDGKECTADLLPICQEVLARKTLSEKLNVLLIYADCLLKLYAKPARDITKKNYVIMPHSATLNEICLSNFTSMSNGRRVRSGPYKDKTLCHAIVFLLLINNLKIELNSLCETLKLSPATASTKARVTGASIATVGGKKVVQLKLPLNTKKIFRRKSAKF